MSPNQAYTFSPTQRVPVGAYGKSQALNMGVSGAGDKPFLVCEQNSRKEDKFIFIHYIMIKMFGLKYILAE